MASISERENREIEAANASGNTPVVFVHGLWVLPSSWANWADFFTQAGYAPLTPDWPDDPETVEEARANPDVLAKKTLKQIADHTTEIIHALDKKPVVMGTRPGACWRRCSRAGASRRPRWRSTPGSSAASSRRRESPYIVPVLPPARSHVAERKPGLSCSGGWAVDHPSLILRPHPDDDRRSWNDHPFDLARTVHALQHADDLCERIVLRDDDQTAGFHTCEAVGVRVLRAGGSTDRRQDLSHDRSQRSFIGASDAAEDPPFGSFRRLEPQAHPI